MPAPVGVLGAQALPVAAGPHELPVGTPDIKGPAAAAMVGYRASTIARLATAANTTTPTLSPTLACAMMSVRYPMSVSRHAGRRLLVGQRAARLSMRPSSEPRFLGGATRAVFGR